MNSATEIWSSRIIAFFNVVVVMCSIAITWTFMTQSFSFATLFDSLVDFDPWGWWSSRVASEASTSYDWFHCCLLPQHHKFCTCWVGSSSPHHTHYPNKGIFKHQPIVNEGKITFWIFSLYKSKVFLQSFLNFGLECAKCLDRLKITYELGIIESFVCCHCCYPTSPKISHASHKNMHPIANWKPMKKIEQEPIAFLSGWTNY